MPLYVCRYAGATNTEDDVAILSNRLGLRPDDIGDTLETAAALSLPANVSGTVGFSGDVDIFKFQLSRSGRVEATLSLVGPFVREGAVVGRGRSNLDAELALLDGKGAALQAWTNDDGLLAGTFTSESVAAAGTYYLRIRGVGQGQNATVGKHAHSSYSCDIGGWGYQPLVLRLVYHFICNGWMQGFNMQLCMGANSPAVCADMYVCARPYKQVMCHIPSYNN